MYRELLRDAQFFRLLLKIDREEAALVQAGKCPRCGGPLHEGNFDRKPRGLLLPDGEFPEGYQQRFDLCCGWCRRRTMPSSVRFLGRKVYWAAALVVATALTSAGERNAARLARRELGASSRTISRWRRWWVQLTGSAFWIGVRGQLPIDLDVSAVPASLLTVFAGGEAERMLHLLRWLGPVTVS